MMQLLDTMAREPGPMSLKNLSQSTALHPSTAHRILAVMVGSHLAERVEPGSYRLGIRLLELGNLVKARINVRHEALPYMRELQRQIAETVNLSVRQDDEVVYVERTTSNQTMMRVVQVDGARAPLHITAVGKVFLAADNAEAVNAYVKRNGLKAYTANTLTSDTALIKELAEIAKRGFAYDNEEAEKGVCCIGAGIYNDDGKLVAGLSVSAPSDRLDRAWAAQVKATAEKISRAMGYQ
ncbi:MAG: IclR family transcriptional regulator [Burkholderiales bacterium]|nr:IclR family transcriptional regulator [Burkholderiales bacterium]